MQVRHIFSKKYCFRIIMIFCFSIKCIKMKKTLFVLVINMLMVLHSLPLRSQTDVVEFIMGGVNDGEKLIQAYLEPLGNSMGANLNGGWYNTAKVHSTLGFDITLTITAAMPPESAKQFNISDLELERLALKDADDFLAPTIAGVRDRGPFLEFKDDAFQGPLFEFETVPGLDLPAFPLPMVKAAIGLPKGIEVMGRFFPKYSYEDMSVYLWGAGVKYDLLQHIPGVSKVPFLNASVMGAYTKVNFSSDIDFQKSRYGNYLDENPVYGGQGLYEDQNLEINMQGFTGMALISMDFPLITVYGGAGYSQAITNVDLLGDYPLLTVNNTEEAPRLMIEDVNNPISLEFDNFSGLQFNAGIRLKFAVITLHADYTMANYNMISAGIGVSLR